MRSGHWSDLLSASLQGPSQGGTQHSSGPVCDSHICMHVSKLYTTKLNLVGTVLWSS